MRMPTLIGALLFALAFAVPALPASAWAAHAASPPAAPTQATALERAVELELERASARTEPLWTRALALREAERSLGGQVPLDAILERHLNRADGLSARARLLLAAARLTGDSPDVERLADLLAPLASSPEPELARTAADLFTKTPFRRLDRDRRSELAEALMAVASNADLSAEVRIDAARGAFALGAGAEKRAARGELLAFLRSSDATLRGLAALALAGTGEELAGDLERELERLASLPGDRGELADALLRAERAKRLRDRRLRDLQDQFDARVLPDELRRLNAVLELVERAHVDGESLKREELVEAALQGLLRHVDEHSSYMSPTAYASFLQDLEAEYGGIGAFVGEDPTDNLFTITRPIYSGPAYRAGLQSDDKIVRVDDWPTLGQPVETIIDRLKGKPGTTVRLYVWRRGMDPSLIDRPTDDMRVIVERAIIEVPAIHYQMLPGRIGLIELSTFSRVASRELDKALESLERDGMRALVLDLRRNSGGLLPEAVAVVDRFLPRGKLAVRTEYRGGASDPLFTQGPARVPADVPVAVLISRFSASASEIVAGSLADHGRAVLVGERSFGKGTVQNLIPLPGFQDDQFIDENGNGRFDPWETLTVDHNGNGEFDFAPRVKLTIARYLLPSGRSIHREFDRERNLISEGGVQPDRKVEFPRVETWRLEGRLELRNSGAVRRWVDEHFEDHRELMIELAESDYSDPDRYPGFRSFYAGLDTRLPEDDVRLMLRGEVRRRVQDLRGGEFPLGDFQEDPQVQAAIAEVLERLGESPKDYEPFRATFRLQETEPLPGAVAALSRTDRAALDGAVDSLRRAREGDGRLEREQLDAVLRLLGQIRSD